MKRIREEVSSTESENRRNPQVSSLEQIDALNFIRSIKNIFKDNNKEKYDQFLKLMNDFQAQRINTDDVISRVKDLFKGHKHLLLRFDTFLPKGYRINLLPEAENPQNRAYINLAFGFVTKIQAKFGDDVFKRFLKILEMYRKNKMSIPKVRDEVTKLLKGHQDLLMEFKNLLPKPNHKDIAIPNPKHPPKKLKPRCKLKAQREDTERETNKSPIKELDPSEWALCTPSYRHLPKDYPVEIPKYRDDIGKEVLNDHLVSVNSRREEYSFNHKRINPYEESLFRCEDDMYEMDMLVESLQSTIERVNKLQEQIDNNKIAIGAKIRIEDHLSILNLRCIERIYDDLGLEMIDLLKKNARKALPVILPRLEQKKEEWKNCSSSFQTVWAKVYAKNHPKLRSFDIKQQESKNLSTQCLVAEIKDINEKKHQEDLSKAIAVRTLRSLTPDLEFKYCDSQIHQDLYRLIEYYCEEKCTPEQSVKVMKLWSTFLEPMFGILSSSRSSNLAVEDVSWPFQASRVFYGNDSYYVLFRLHQMLYARIQSAKKHAQDNTTPDPFTRFMESLDGSIDNTKFEDKCQAVFGAESKCLFTLDTLLQKLVKHLHKVATNETDTKLLQLNENYRTQERFIEVMYHQNVCDLLLEANTYRIIYSSKETRLSIQLMNNHLEVTGVAAMGSDSANDLQDEVLTSLVFDKLHKKQRKT